MRISERNNPVDTKVSAGGRGMGAEIPLQCVVVITVEEAVPLAAHGGYWWSRSHLQPVEDPKPEKLDAQTRL